jgi:hypothetical protein
MDKTAEMNKKWAGERGMLLTSIKKEVGKAGFNSGDLLTDIKKLITSYHDFKQKQALGMKA